jgi:hypothetical protein
MLGALFVRKTFTGSYGPQLEPQIAVRYAPPNNSGGKQNETAQDRRHHHRRGD